MSDPEYKYSRKKPPVKSLEALARSSDVGRRVKKVLAQSHNPELPKELPQTGHTLPYRQDERIESIVCS